ncbi:MAG: tail fiber domain-containing protein, partial [Saprospiraceae bacterium]|nr:tail fiber domain-containing protein [Saprospiraceae bacterium]
DNTTAAGTERMRICANGRVGIGTGAPTQKLHVGGGNIMLDYSDVPATKGSLFFGGVTYPTNQSGMRMSFYSSPGAGFKNGYIDVRTFGGTADDGLVFRVDGATGNTERMRICANGNVGIGTATPGTFRLNVNGTAAVTSGFWSVSDQRFKKNIAPVQNGLEKVLALQGKTYEFDREKFEDRNFSAGRHYGFLAQELRQVMPEAVMENTDGYLAVNYDMVIPVLTEAVKDLKAEKDQQLSEMETRLAEKDRQISALEARLAKLEAAFDRTAIPAVQTQDFQMSNQPNPFSGTTTVKCTIPETVRTAQLIVTDMTGREIARQIVSERGQTSVEMNLQTAPGGTYICTLLADGKAVGTLKLAVSGK